MAKGSKKGACSAHVSAAKSNCLQHARRITVPSYVNPRLTKNNRTVFESESIRNRKSIMPLVRAAEKLYSEKTGQKCQKSFTPFREDVLVVKAGITNEQLLDYKEKVEKLTGWKVMGIWLHQDEGHFRSKYIEGDDHFSINYHAHVLYACQDPETGKAIRCTRDYFRLRQDLLAESTGMERGNSAIETGISHRSSLVQRIFSQEERLEKLSEKISQRHAQILDANANLDSILHKNAAQEDRRDGLRVELEKLKREKIHLMKDIWAKDFVQGEAVKEHFSNYCEGRQAFEEAVLFIKKTRKSFYIKDDVVLDGFYGWIRAQEALTGENLRNEKGATKAAVAMLGEIPQNTQEYRNAEASMKQTLHAMNILLKREERDIGLGAGGGGSTSSLRWDDRDPNEQDSSYSRRRGR